MVKDGGFSHGRRKGRDKANKEREGRDVLEDIAALVGDKEHIELFERLVYETDVICLHGGMLRVDGDELWERSEETVDARSGDGPELAGEEGLSAPGAD